MFGRKHARHRNAEGAGARKCFAGMAITNIIDEQNIACLPVHTFAGGQKCVEEQVDFCGGEVASISEGIAPVAVEECGGVESDAGEK